MGLYPGGVAGISSDDTRPRGRSIGSSPEGATRVSALIRLYPAAWRARYGAEFEELLAARPPSRRDLLDIVLAAVDARLSPQVASARIARHARVSDRLAGAAALAGGLVWSATYLIGWLVRAEGDLSLPILVALALMLLSLPGTYVRPYARPVALAAVAVVASFALLLAEVLPWDLLVLVPALAIIGALGPGALALAAARAGTPAGGRWRLLLLTIPWPIIGTIAVFAGLVPNAVPEPLVIGSFLPLGIAWIVTGVRIARGPVVSVSAITTAGGTA